MPLEPSTNRMEVATKREQIWALTRENFLQQWRQLNRENPSAAKAFLRIRCATDLALFATYFFPHYCRHPFNQFHRDVFSSTVFGERARRSVRAAPRGYAK